MKTAAPCAEEAAELFACLPISRWFLDRFRRPLQIVSGLTAEAACSAGNYVPEIARIRVVP